MGAPADRLTVIPIGVRRIAADPGASARARAQLGVGEGEVLLLFVGWQYVFSGLRELVADFARRGRDVPWLRLAIVGRGDLYEELQQVRKASGLERQIIMTGQVPVDDVAPLIEAADFGLLPAYRNETMEYLVPTKLVEYMEHGKAVIATRLPGLEVEFASVPGLANFERSQDRLLEVEYLVHVLAVTNTDDVERGRWVADQRHGHIHDRCRRSAWDVRVPRLAFGQGREDRVDGAVEGQEEPRHASHRHGDGSPGPDLIEEERNDRAARGDDVPVADTQELRAMPEVAVDEDALLQRLRHAHHVDGLAGLVR